MYIFNKVVYMVSVEKNYFAAQYVGKYYNHPYTQKE